MTTNPTLLDLRADLQAAEKEFRLLEAEFVTLHNRITVLETLVLQAIAQEGEASPQKRLGLLSGSLFGR